jgi:two-component system response regulator HydG
LSFPIGTPLAEIEMRVIHETLRQTKGDKRLAAKLLGIATRTIYRRLEATDEPEADHDPGDIDGDTESVLGADAATRRLEP